MGCGRSSAVGECKVSSTEMSEDSSDDKRRNYGGVYVGLPADASTSNKDSKGGVGRGRAQAPSPKSEYNLPGNTC